MNIRDRVTITPTMALSYLKAKFGGTATPEKELKRLETCFACEYLLVEKRNQQGVLDANGIQVENPFYYCSECGCPRKTYWKDSELRNKAKMDKAACPKGKWD